MTGLTQEQIDAMNIPKDTPVEIYGVVGSKKLVYYTGSYFVSEQFSRGFPEIRKINVLEKTCNKITSEDFDEIDYLPYEERSEAITKRFFEKE